MPADMLKHYAAARGVLYGTPAEALEAAGLRE
jgi:hypothetical protein